MGATPKGLLKLRGIKYECQRTNQNAVDVVGLEPCGCPVICLGHNSPTRFKMNMNKAQLYAVHLYIEPGFAHMHSIVNAYGLI